MGSFEARSSHKKQKTSIDRDANRPPQKEGAGQGHLLFGSEVRTKVGAEGETAEGEKGETDKRFPRS